MEKSIPGMETVVREGEEAFSGRQELIEEQGPPPCVVRHPAAGGRCERSAVIEVYGLEFCEVHGAEAKSGALEELYFDAANFLERLDNPHIPPPNPVARQALREAVEGLRAAECWAYGEPGEEANAALLRAYPLIPERMDRDAADFDYHNPGGGETPVDWNYRERMLIHKLMRLAHQDGCVDYLVELLEEQREYVAAQEAFALADQERKLGLKG
jgi:hypothetical protein